MGKFKTFLAYAVSEVKQAEQKERYQNKIRGNPNLQKKILGFVFSTIVGISVLGLLVR